MIFKEAERLAVAGATNGQLDRAEAKMRAVDPKLRVSGLSEIVPFRRREDFDRWAGALQVAGLPD